MMYLSEFPKRWIVFLMMVVLTLFSTGLWAQDTPSVPPPPSSRVDKIHGFISRMFVRPLGWFDRFFLNENEEIETNRSFVKVVGDYEWVNQKGFDYRTRVRAKIRLPALQERLSLVIFGDEEDALKKPEPDIQADEATAGAPLPTGERTGRVGLRYMLFDYLNSRIDIDAALQSKLRTEVTARFRQRIPVTRRTLGRFTLTGFWLDRTGFGIRPRVDLERALNQKLGLRWGTQATYIEGGPGFAWESRIALDAKISSKDALSYSVVAQGPTQPSTVVDLYRTSVVYRRAIHRNWVFLELEPGYQWQRTDSDHYPPVATMGFRIEVRFQED